MVIKWKRKSFEAVTVSSSVVSSCGNKSSGVYVGISDVSGLYAANRRIELKDLYPVEIQATINKQNVYAKVMSMRNYSVESISPTWIKVQFYDDEAKNEWAEMDIKHTKRWY